MGAAFSNFAHQVQRETTSDQCLTLFKRNPKEFLRRFVTVDDTWIHWYTLETKKQSKQWTSTSECAPTCPIGWKGDVHRSVGLTRCDLHRLHGEGQNGHRALLCRIIGPIRRQIAEKTAPLCEEKCVLPP